MININARYPVLYRKIRNQVILYEMRNFKTLILNRDETVFGEIKGTKCFTMQQIEEMEKNQLQIEKVDYEQIKAPISVCVALTNYCNLQCKYCYALSSGNQMQCGEKVAERLNETEEIISIMLTGGEIFTWEGLEEFVLRLDTKDKNVTLATNGTCVQQYLQRHERLFELLKNNKITLEISLDHCRMEINDIFRGQSMAVLDTMQFLKKHRIPIRVCTVLSNENLLFLDEFAEYLQMQLLKNWTLLPMIGYPEYSCNIEDEKEIISKLEDKYQDGIIISYNRTKKSPYSLFMIDSCGNYFLPGKNAKDRKILGNVENISLKEAWKCVDRKSNISRYIVEE